MIFRAQGFLGCWRLCLFRVCGLGCVGFVSPGLGLVSRHQGSGSASGFASFVYGLGKSRASTEEKRLESWPRQGLGFRAVWTTMKPTVTAHKCSGCYVACLPMLLTSLTSHSGSRQSSGSRFRSPNRLIWLLLAFVCLGRL